MQLEHIFWRIEGRLQAHEEVLSRLVKDSSPKLRLFFAQPDWIDALSGVDLNPEAKPFMQEGWNEAIHRIRRDIVPPS